MIRIAITEAAFEAIARTLPADRAAGAERSISGKYLVWIEKAVHGQLEGLRRPDECLSDVILRLVEIEPAAKPKRARR